MKIGDVPCPVCQRRMWNGDVICLACTKRVRAVRPDLLTRHAGRMEGISAEAGQLENDIVLCAVQQLPRVGAPLKQKGAAS